MSQASILITDDTTGEAMVIGFTSDLDPIALARLLIASPPPGELSKLTVTRGTALNPGEVADITGQTPALAGDKLGEWTDLPPEFRY